MKYKKYVIAVLSLFLIVTMLSVHRNKDKVAIVSFLSPFDVTSITESDLSESIVWEKKENITFKELSMDRSKVGDCYYIAGDIRQLRSWDILSGTLSFDTDTEGIILTSSLADSLFHSVKTVGSIVKIQDRSYIVRCVVKDVKEEAFVSVLEKDLVTNSYKNTMDKEVSLDHATIHVPKLYFSGQKKEQAIHFWLQKHRYPSTTKIRWTNNKKQEI